MDLKQAFKFVILLVLSSSAFANEAVPNKHPTNTVSLLFNLINFFV